MNNPVKFTFNHEEAKLPVYSSDLAVGADLHSVEDVELVPGIPVVVRTGLVLADIPPWLELQVRPRSGLAVKGVTVINSPGTVDPDYRGEIKVILMLTTLEGSVSLPKGSRIAQLVLAPVFRGMFNKVAPEDAVDTSRGSSGFGSTGL